MRKLITPLAIAAALLFASQSTFAQNVGINTTQPDPSAALDITGTDKGLLIPRVSLQSLTDNTTIPNPANALLVYNTNAGIGKVGFYYNAGTAASPNWTVVGGNANLALPFFQTGSNLTSLFHINNTGGIGVGSAITGESDNSVGVRGETVTGRGIVGTSSGSGEGITGHATSSGTGVLASAANANGKALEVSGPMKIAGPGQSPGAGKVLMSDANGNATWENVAGNVAFRASGIAGNGNENITPDNITKIAFANENYDLGNNYNASNDSPHSTFIVPKSGIYHFDVSVGWSSGTGSFRTRLQLVLSRNNQLSFIGFDNTLGEKSGTCSISVDVQLLQGDQIFTQIESHSDLTSETLYLNFGHFSGRFLFKE